MHFQNFGKFEIIRKLSRSLTDVYLASDTEANRRVVLKLIEQARDDYTQLVIEAEKRGAALQTQLHYIDPRILQVYEYGEQHGCFFLAMEYCEGKTLAEMLQFERFFDPQRAARYTAEICSQLKTLHSFTSDVNGRETAVVHGDIKPSNIQIGLHDEVRLLDFGIAKVISSTRNLTHHNLGSPSYCSPERISKSQVDQHSDLWAVGVTLYEMLSGAPPYQAQDTRKLENLIQSRRPPRALPPHCPAAVKSIVAKALAADLTHRYASAEALGNDLTAFLENRQTVAERERHTSWHTNATVEKTVPASETVTHSANRAPQKAPAPRAANRWTDFTNIVALLAGILVGLLVFIPIGSYYRYSRATDKLRGTKDYAHQNLQSVAADWNLYQQLKTPPRFVAAWTSSELLSTSMHDHLIAAADDTLDSFRHSADQQLTHFDWNKATVCLRHALEIEPSDTKAKGELALCNGYLALEHNPPKTGEALNNFNQSQWYLPRLPDPHLALARAFVYQLHNIGRAVAEFHQAVQLGYRLGPRELEQEADGYLFRAESELAHARRTPATGKPERGKWLQLARDDMERARSLYEPIAGFSNVSTNLEQLHQDREEQSKLQMENIRLVTQRPRYSKRYASTRRWQ
ncbi:MAG: serine/threonine protein kinase [Acidobacteriaceae bacterium]|nr:serine/threonine protein kinase [Acidobacteriaceae bacterium]